MRTRGGFCYVEQSQKRNIDTRDIKRRKIADGGGEAAPTGFNFDILAALPDDLVLCILCKLSSTASSQADFINLLITCKRLNGLGHQSLVLAKTSLNLLVFKAKNWSESAQSFLELCVKAGNIEACYTLGMIRFYCFHDRYNGASLMAKAASNSHARAFYSLSVIKFNGSGSSKKDKDLRAGVALCARAVLLGHTDAFRELGYCLQDGYGVKQNVVKGRRLLVEANNRELLSIHNLALTSTGDKQLITCDPLVCHQHVACLGGLILSNSGWDIFSPEIHPANRFLMEWYAIRNPNLGFRICSHSGCGRPETRQHEFRRCSACGTVHYCSRSCQLIDWKLRHKVHCALVERLAADAEEEIVP